MFSNCYQSPLFEVYNSKDAKNSHGNKEKLKHYSKLIDLSTSVYEYDALLKTYLLNTKQLKIPYGKDTELSLVHPIIGIQGKFQDSIHLELFVVDTKSTRRRVILNSLKKGETKPFFVTMPVTHQSAYNNWVTLLIDIPTFLSVFKGSSYRSLESILIQSTCQIRRIFMLQQFNENLLTQFTFPLEENSKYVMIKYQNESELFIDQKLQSENLDQQNKKKQLTIQRQTALNKNTKVKQNEIVISENQSKRKNNEQKAKLQTKVLGEQNDNFQNEFLNNHTNTEDDLKNIDALINIIEEDNNQLEKQIKSARGEIDHEYKDNLIDIIDAINKDEKAQEKEEFVIKNPIGCTTITRQGNNTVVFENRREQENFVQLLFDPILNCYFDPKSNKIFV